MAVLQLSGGHISTMRRTGKLSSSGRDDEYNLAEILEHYQLMLKTTGILAEQQETTCIRDFRAGKHPEEVMIERGYPFDIVKQAWEHHLAFARDPAAVQVASEREAAARAQEATRCRECLRTISAAREDTMRIVSETTLDPDRDEFMLLEERALVGLDIRCPSCRMIKATAPVDSIKARLRALAIMGFPKPIDVDRDMPLPPSASDAPSASTAPSLNEPGTVASQNDDDETHA